jgi:hypothetical protein
MFGSRVRSKLAMVITAPIVATVAIVGSSPLAFAAERAAPAPVVVSFTAAPATLTYLGGKVVLAATLDNASSCVLSVTPSLKGLPKSFPCSNSVRAKLTVPANKTAAAISYTFGLAVKNKTAVVAATPAVVAEPAIPAPVVSAFTASTASLSDAGGKVVLRASFQYGQSCALSVTPVLKGFPKTFACSTKVSTSVNLAADETSSPISYSFSLSVANKTGNVAATPVVVAVAAAPPVPAPVVNSFTASSSTISDAGGKLVLRASLQYGSTCVLSVTPNPKGLPKTSPCSNSFSDSVALAANKTPNADSYTFALSVANRTSTVSATNVVVAVDAMPPPISFTPTSLTFAKEGVFVADEPLIVTVHNNASTTQVISSVAIGTLGEPSDFLLNKNNCSYLTAHESCSFAIQFQPTGAGPRTGVVDVLDSTWGTSGGMAHLNVFGTGVWATATVANSSISHNVLNFAVQGVLTKSPLQYVTVSNVGAVPLYISGIIVTGDESTDFSISPGNCINQITGSFPFVVGVSQKCTFGVAFEPSAAAQRSTYVVVDDNTIGTQTQLQVAGTGAFTTDTVDNASQSSGPLNIDFGNEVVGLTTTDTLTIANTGNVDLSFAGASISGINATEFGIAASGTCVDAGVEIAVGGSCTVSISFTPAALGARSAVLKIDDNTSLGFETVDLTGTGTAPST